MWGLRFGRGAMWGTALTLAWLLPVCGAQGSAVEGKLVDWNNEPVAGVKIVAAPSQPRKGYEQAEAITKADGTFRITGLYPSSQYVLRPVSDKWRCETAVRLDTAPEGETVLMPSAIVIDAVFTNTDPPLRADIVTGEVEQVVAAEQVAYAKTIGQPVIMTNGQGQRLMLVPPGRFQMGSPADEEGRHADEGPQHPVELTRGFYIGATEVTQAEYGRYDGSHGTWFSGADRPVDHVTWDDAQRYCQWLTEQERGAGQSPAGWEYRLPTEAEWEYACRAGSQTAYSFGSEEGRLGEYAWYEGNSGRQTQPVARKRANAWGLYDMHGNLKEWCGDYYAQDYYGRSPARDPAGPISGRSVRERVLRGGSWYSLRPQLCRSANRNGLTPEFTHGSIGFRVVLSPAPGS